MVINVGEKPKNSTDDDLDLALALAEAEEEEKKRPRVKPAEMISSMPAESTNVVPSLSGRNISRKGAAPTIDEVLYGKDLADNTRALTPANVGIRALGALSLPARAIGTITGQGDITDANTNIMRPLSSTLRKAGEGIDYTKLPGGTGLKTAVGGTLETLAELGGMGVDAVGDPTTFVGGSVASKGSRGLVAGIDALKSGGTLAEAQAAVKTARTAHELEQQLKPVPTLISTLASKVPEIGDKPPVYESYSARVMADAPPEAMNALEHARRAMNTQAGTINLGMAGEKRIKDLTADDIKNMVDEHQALTSEKIDPTVSTAVAEAMKDHLPNLRRDVSVDPLGVSFVKAADEPISSSGVPVVAPAVVKTGLTGWGRTIPDRVLNAIAQPRATMNMPFPEVLKAARAAKNDAKQHSAWTIAGSSAFDGGFQHIGDQLKYLASAKEGLLQDNADKAVDLTDIVNGWRKLVETRLGGKLVREATYDDAGKVTGSTIRVKTDPTNIVVDPYSVKTVEDVSNLLETLPKNKSGRVIVNPKMADSMKRYMQHLVYAPDGTPNGDVAGRILSQTAPQINGRISESIGDQYRILNGHLSDFINLDQTLSRALGAPIRRAVNEEGDPTIYKRAASTLKRMFASDTSPELTELSNQIQQLTGGMYDPMQAAMYAAAATRAVGDDRAFSRLIDIPIVSKNWDKVKGGEGLLGKAAAVIESAPGVVGRVASGFKDDGAWLENYYKKAQAYHETHAVPEIMYGEPNMPPPPGSDFDPFAPTGSALHDLPVANAWEPKVKPASSGDIPVDIHTGPANGPKIDTPPTGWEALARKLDNGNEEDFWNNTQFMAEQGDERARQILGWDKPAGVPIDELDPTLHDGGNTDPVGQPWNPMYDEIHGVKGASRDEFDQTPRDANGYPIIDFASGAHTDAGLNALKSWRRLSPREVGETIAVKGAFGAGGAGMSYATAPDDMSEGEKRKQALIAGALSAGLPGVLRDNSTLFTDGLRARGRELMGREGDRLGVASGRTFEKKSFDDFIDNALSDKSFQGNIPIITSNNRAVDAIKKLFGIDLSSRSHTADDIRHIIKRHGVGGSGLREGDIPITSDDLKLIPAILDHFETASDKSQGPQKSIGYKYPMNDGDVTLIEQIIGKGKGQLKTMWKNSRGLIDAPEGTPTGTPNATPGSVLPHRDIIPQNEPVVKPSNTEMLSKIANLSRVWGTR